MKNHYRAHPWHGVVSGKNPPRFLNAYIEITAHDGVKYELDKESGLLKVDRPQLHSSLPPLLYGFIPRTYCGTRIAGLASVAKGDGDPLDVCVFSERPIMHPDILLPCRVIGGLTLVDKGEADDKILAVLDNDPYWAHANDIADVPEILIKRIEHYFLTYKQPPGEDSQITIQRRYGAIIADTVVQAAIEDYNDEFAQ